jgi:excisionase family DNA binding protein
MTIKKGDEILTLSEACKLLGCHPNTLRQWDNKGFLKAIRFGVRDDRRYHRKDIEKMIIKMKQK